MRTNTQSTSLPSVTELRSSPWPVHTVSPRGRSIGLNAASRKVEGPIVCVVDADHTARDAVCEILQRHGYAVRGFPDEVRLLQDYRPNQAGCMLVKVALPGMTEVELIRRLKVIDPAASVILMDSNLTLATAIWAMRGGAVDLIEAPVSPGQLLKSVERVLTAKRMVGCRDRHTPGMYHFTQRQREILDLILDGSPSKNIAADLGISQRTVENHRAAIMKKTGCRSVVGLVRATLPFANGNEAPND